MQQVRPLRAPSLLQRWIEWRSFVRSFHEGGNHPEEEVREDATIRGREWRREGEGGEARMKKTEESLSERGEREGGEICISIAVAPGESPRNQLNDGHFLPPPSTPHLASQREMSCQLRILLIETDLRRRLASAQVVGNDTEVFPK